MSLQPSLLLHAECLLCLAMVCVFRSIDGMPPVFCAFSRQRSQNSRFDLMQSAPNHPQTLHLYIACRGITDLPPEFYDFTPDDYQKVMSSWAKQNSQGAGPLKTQKLREQDERRRAEQFGPVPVRVHFPDGTIVQAEFRPTETLSSLQKLLQQCMQPSLTQWHMYVTPPKQVFKDLSLTFYKAGLLPAANVLIGLDSRHEGPCLKSEIATLQAAPPARNIVRQTSKVDAPGAHRGNVGSGAHFLPSSKATGEKKVPKWMKLGK